MANKPLDAPQSPLNADPASIAFAPSPDPEVTDLQRRLLEIQYAIASKQYKEMTESESASKEARKQGALTLKAKHDDDMKKQAFCPHLKPNASSAISGQRDHRGNYHLICAYCFKQFNGFKAVPIQCQPSLDLIGGPEH